MSFDIAWEKLDNEAVDTSIDFLNLYFENLQERPDFLGKVKILDLNFGSSPPSVEVKDVGEPFEEFYDSLAKGLALTRSFSGSADGLSSPFSRSEIDSQFLLEFRYSGKRNRCKIFGVNPSRKYEYDDIR